MSNSVDPDETAHFDATLLQKPIIMTCGSERVSNTNSYYKEFTHGKVGVFNFYQVDLVAHLETVVQFQGK